MPPSIALVILNFNGRDLLAKFLPSIISFSGMAEIIVADNNSTDDSIDFLKKNYPKIRLIPLANNYGFAGGYNQALKQVQADYFILLNSDVEVTQNWIPPIIDLMEADKSIAACQPKILSYHKKEKNQFEYAGAGGGMIDYLGYPFCRGRMFDSLEIDEGQYNDSKEIFWASGAAMFVRAAIFNELSGFDADFFAHMEEIDLCWRMKNVGYSIYYCGGATVYHVGGATLNSENPKKTFLNYRNSLMMLYKNLPAHKFFSTLFIRLALDGVAGIKLLLSGNIRGVFSILKAHFAFYMQLSTLVKKRKSYKQNVVSMIYPKSIVYQYFIKGIRIFENLP